MATLFPVESTRCLNGCTVNMYRSIAIDHEMIESKDANRAVFDIDTFTVEGNAKHSQYTSRAHSGVGQSQIHDKISHRISQTFQRIFYQTNQE